MVVSVLIPLVVIVSCFAFSVSPDAKSDSFLKYSRSERGWHDVTHLPRVLGISLESVVDLVTFWKLTGVVILAPVTNDAAGTYLLRRIPNAVSIPLGVHALKNFHIEARQTFVVVDVENGGAFDVFELAFGMGLFTRNYSWIVFTKRFLYSGLLASRSFEAQVTLLQLNGTMKLLQTANSFTDSGEVSIYDIFLSKQSGDVHRVQFASWSRGRGLVLVERCTREEQVLLRNREILFYSFNHVPFIFATFENGGSVTGGYMKEVFDCVFDNVGMFRPKYYISNDTNFGFMVGPDGKFSGAIGRLQRKEVDMTMLVLTMLNTRFRVMRYTNHGSQHYFMGICIAKPKESLSTKSYILPFEMQVWLVVIVALAISVALLVVATVLTPVYEQESAAEMLQKTFLQRKIYWVLSGSFLLDAFEDTQSTSVKIVLRTLQVAAMVTFIYYTSLFTSALAYRGDELPMKTLDDVYENRDYAAIAIPTTRFYEHFKVANSGVFAGIWTSKLSKMKFENLPVDSRQGIEMVKSGKYAFLHDITSMTYESGRDCSVVISPARYNGEYSYVGSRFDFPYTRIISFQLLCIKEKGILDRIGKKIFPDHRELCNNPPTGNDSLSLTQVIGLFIVVAAGIAMSFIALLVEIIIWKLRKNNVHSRYP